MNSIITITPEDSKSNQNLAQLVEELASKENEIKSYQQRIKSLLEDFNYNVNLIYERDREIEELSRKNEELLILNHEKDVVILSMQSLYSRLDNLESDNKTLKQKIDSLTSGSKYYKGNNNEIPRVYTTRRSTDNHIKTHKKCMSADKAYSKLDKNELPLRLLNSEIEKRIKVLEKETEKCEIQSSLDESSISVYGERFQSKDREISELIRSLSTYQSVPIQLRQSRSRNMKGVIDE